MDASKEPLATALKFRVPPEPASLFAVRQRLSQLSPRLEERTAQDLRLLVNELVTNSLRHASFVPGEQIEIRIEVGGRTIRVEVQDPGPGFRQGPLAESPSRADRWGLYLVDRLAESWGVDTASGCRVWFEMRAGERV